jgi:hypothetical protein
LAKTFLNRKGLSVSTLLKFPSFFTHRINEFMNKYIILFFMLFSLLFGFNTSNLDEGMDPTKLRFKVAMATRTESPPVIDGVIDDDVWQRLCS